MCLQEDFIEYWDKVVRQWLDNNANHKSFTNDAQEQHQIIEAINSSVGKNSKYWLNTDHMPEPYWGDPKKCSIVLLDYNPAGGSQPSRHTSISCKNCTNMGESFIHYINTYRYSEFALNGPVFRNDCDDWFTSYGGYGWWQEKREWLDHLVEANLKNKEEKPNYKLPFGMELCGWHSENWKDMSWIKNGCRDIVDKRAIQPLFESLKYSSAQMAVCIGAEFKPSILESFFINNESDFDVTQSQCILSALKDNDILREKGYRILETEEINSKPKLGKESKNSIGVAVKKDKEKETTRYYRVYNVVTEGENHIILNTFAPGGNRHPAEEWWPFEDILIKAIRDKYPIKQLL